MRFSINKTAMYINDFNNDFCEKRSVQIGSNILGFIPLVGTVVGLGRMIRQAMLTRSDYLNKNNESESINKARFRAIKLLQGASELIPLVLVIFWVARLLYLGFNDSKLSKYIKLKLELKKNNPGKQDSVTSLDKLTERPSLAGSSFTKLDEAVIPPGILNNEALAIEKKVSETFPEASLLDQTLPEEQSTQNPTNNALITHSESVAYESAGIADEAENGKLQIGKIKKIMWGRNGEGLSQRNFPENQIKDLCQSDSNNQDFLYLLAPYLLADDFLYLLDFILRQNVKTLNLKAFLALASRQLFYGNFNSNEFYEKAKMLLQPYSQSDGSTIDLIDRIFCGYNFQNEAGFTNSVEFKEFEYKGTEKEKKEAYILRFKYDLIVEIFSKKISFYPQFNDFYIAQLIAIRNPLIRERILNRLPLVLNLLGPDFKINDELRFSYQGVPLFPLYCELLLSFNQENADALYKKVYIQRKTLKDRKKQVLLLELMEKIFFSIEDIKAKKLIIEHVLDNKRFVEQRSQDWIFLLSKKGLDEKVLVEELHSIERKDQNWTTVSKFLENKNLKNIKDRLNLLEITISLSSEKIRVLEALFLKYDSWSRGFPTNPIKLRLEELVKAILDERYQEARYKDLDGLTIQQKESWKQDLTETGDNWIARETDDPWEMLLATHKIWGCMSIYSEDASRYGPILYFTSELTRLIIVEDREGNLLARAYIRLNIKKRTLTYELYKKRHSLNPIENDKSQNLFDVILNKKLKSLGEDWKIKEGLFTP